MSKPTDIPQDVLDRAVKAFFEAMDQPADDWTKSAHVIALAIMAAEKRGEEREREACSTLLLAAAEKKQALRLALGEMTAQEMRTLVAGIGFLAAAIIKRGA